VGGVSQSLREGEVWEINNADVHAVANASAHARVHLIVDWTPSKTLLKEKKPFRMDLPMFYRAEARIDA
jgi:nicotinamide mononucleotide adenylyltransferase